MHSSCTELQSRNLTRNPGVFTPVLAKHSKHFSLQDSLARRLLEGGEVGALL
jgi:hypothetical protein